MWGSMGTWFGGSGSGSQARKDAPKKAILDLRQQLDMLNKREKHLENQMAEQEALARKYISSNNKTGMLRGSAPLEEAERFGGPILMEGLQRHAQR
jgi:hypothetical protein